MLGNFNEEAQRVLIGAKIEMNELKHPYVGTEHLILAILNKDITLKDKLKNYGLTYQKFKEEIIKIIGTGTKEPELYIYTPLLKKVIQNAILDSKDNNNGEVTPEHLISALLEEGEGIAIRILIGMNIDLENMYEDFSYRLIKKNKRKKAKKLLIEQLGTNLTEQAKNTELDPVIGREEETQRILEILGRRTKNNPLLVGKAGIGKTAIVEEIARRIAQNKVPENLQNKKVISLDMATLVAGTKYRGEFEEKMKKILQEIEENKDIIIFIDEIHTLVGAGGAEGAIDASNILKPALARGKIRCIGATTLDEYKKYIEKDSALDRRFQKITIEEPTLEKTEKILLKLKPIYEKYHKVKIRNNLIKEIVSLSDKYIHNQNLPDKAIDVLDETCSKVNMKKDYKQIQLIKLKNKLKNITKTKNSYIIENNITKAYEYRKQETYYQKKIKNLEINKNNTYKEVTLENIAEVINIKTQIPVYEILKDNNTIINKIEENLSNKIIGQEEVIHKLVDITKKIKLGFHNNQVTSLLFIGPSGVGKTQISKLYADLLVGEQNFIRLDMSEYSSSTSINKIIGSDPGYVGYNDNKSILEEVKNHPHSVILLDEIDKAHPKIINLLYQILDEGKVKNNQGQNIYFNNTIIIMTSNIGFEINKVGFNQPTKQNILSSLKNDLPQAFINRIDDILIFKQLSKENIFQIIENTLEITKQKYKNLELFITSNVKKELIELSNYQEYGARKIQKIISSQIENKIINTIINNKKTLTIDTIKEPSIS